MEDPNPLTVADIRRFVESLKKAPQITKFKYSISEYVAQELGLLEDDRSNHAEQPNTVGRNIPKP
jgi:hypothetical protein